MSEVKDSLLNDLIVVKRSGQRVNFNSTKIAIAIKKAFDQIGIMNSSKLTNKVYEDVLNYIYNNYSDRKTINVEDIQDIIETKLKDNNFKEVYQAFSDYRIRRAESRRAFGIKQQHKFAKAIERIVNDNSESKYVNRKPNDILLDFGKTISCEYTKTYILDNKLVRAHEEGSIYIHNLDYFNLGKLSSTHLIFDNKFEKDFFNSLITTAIMAKYEIDGEIGIDAIDDITIPIFNSRFKDKFKDTLEQYLKITDYIDYINFKKVEEIIEKENSIDFDMNLFDQFALNQKVRNIFKRAYEDSMKLTLKSLSSMFRELLTILNNNYHENKKYSVSLGTNYTFEGLLINNCFMDVINDIDKLDNITVILKIKKEYDMELLNKVSKLIIDGKNIALSFVESSYNKDDNKCVEYFSDGKRIFENPIYEEKCSTGRMITSSVSVNMGRLGFKYGNRDLKGFYSELDELLDISKNCLVTIFETLGDKSRENYRIIFNNNILDDDKLEYGQKIRKIIKKGVLNLELIGLVECVSNLEIDNKKQKDLMIEILKYVNEKCKRYTLESKLNFVVSETSKYRPLKKLIALDKAIYGVKKNISDKDCYSRIDSLFNFKKDIREDLEYIGKYQSLLSGGNLVKIELPKNVKAKDILEIIKISIDKDVGFIRFGLGR